jgi:hypothetical protein
VLEVTFVMAMAYDFITGHAPRRVTGRVHGRRGHQERGEFTDFLAEVFSILGIKRPFRQRLRRREIP